MIESSRIVDELFAGLDSLGTIRLRESACYRPDFRTNDFIGALKKLFARKP